MATHQKTDSARSFFDLLWNINPAAIIDTFRRIDVRFRLLIIFVITIGALSVAGNKLVGWGLDYIAEQNQPSLIERLSAPYDLGTRAAPVFVSQQSSVLGAPIADFTLIAPSQTLAEIRDEMETAREAAKAEAAEAAASGDAPADVADDAEPVAVAIRPAECLQFALLKNVEVVHTCELGQQPKYYEVGTFQRGNNPSVEVVITNFTNAETARDTVRELRGYTNNVGFVGNYVMVNSQPVNYFYSVTNRAISFTWSNEHWVYTMTSASADEIDALLADFPF